MGVRNRYLVYKCAVLNIPDKAEEDLERASDSETLVPIYRDNFSFCIQTPDQ